MAAFDKNFLGMDGTIYWFGICENRQDPLGLGRVQVRIYGWHNDSLTEIPSENLPWASVSHSVNDRIFGTPREDDLLFGIFLDGRSGQFPLVMGIVPGYFTQSPNTGAGFNDLRSKATLKNAPKHPVSRTYNTDGSGITINEANTADSAVLESLRHPNVDELDKPSITGIARYQNLANTVIQARKTNLVKGIKTANNIIWSEPYPAYNPLYPYNQVNETESGHVFELDDTPGSERVHIAHRSGSYEEWFPTGTKVEKITKSNYQIVMADDYLHVMGKVALSVGGDVLIRANGNIMIEGGGDLSYNVAGDINFVSGGAFNIKAQSYNQEVSDDSTIVATSIHHTGSGSVDIYSGGNFNIQGALNLNLNGGASAVLQGSTVSLTGIVMADSISPGAIPAGDASQGSSRGLPGAISGLQKNSGQAAPERVPVPIPGPFLPNFDAHTGTAFKHELFLGTDGNSPDSNVANTDCNFDPMSHTFISGSSNFNISDTGLHLIQGFEGFAKVVSPNQVTAYPDPATGGEPLTIGYGSTAVGIRQPVTLGEMISRETAQSYLTTSINNEYLPALRQGVTVALTQNMIDSLLSLIYNIGPTNFTNSNLRKLINQQQWCAAGNAFLSWNKAAGRILPALSSRRQTERNLFLK